MVPSAFQEASVAHGEEGLASRAWPLKTQEPRWEVSPTLGQSQGGGGGRGLRSTDTQTHTPAPSSCRQFKTREKSKKSIHKVPCLWVEPGSVLAALQAGDSTGCAWQDPALALHALPAAKASPAGRSPVASLSAVCCVLESSFTPQQMKGV